jgi:hypothetical protein
LGLIDLDVMHYFIQGLRLDLKSHVILGQPKSLSQAENLANLKEAVLKHTPNFTQQQQLESQFCSYKFGMPYKCTTKQYIKCCCL